MLLKSIEMKGFKSFPNKTKLNFPDGIVSIIGPNGSGKSNILDGVRWVLGEKSAKNLRGEKMEDVIFSGTKILKSMNFCEVEIVFGNEDNFLNIDFSEVAIKRKAYRNGESKFYINGIVCRQKDIKELLLDSGIGKEGYSIISQGKIDEIVNSSPIQRRRIFEEACKISKNRYQKEESERKLDTVRENLERINDIYYEIEKQIKPLKNQSDNAKKYLELKTELKKSDVNRIILELDAIDDEYKKLKNDLSEKTKDIEELDERLNCELAKEQQLNKKEEQLYIDLEKLNVEKNQLIISRGNIENQISSHQLFLESNDKQSRKNLEQIDKTNEGIKNAENEYNERRKEIEVYKFRLDELDRDKEQLEREEGFLKSDVENALEKVEENKESLIDLMNKKSFITSQIDQFKIQKEDESRKISDSEAAKLNQNQKIEELIKDLEISKIFEKEEKDKLSIVNEKQQEVNKRLDQIQEETSKKLEDISKSLIAIKALESKKMVFDDMEAHYEGLSNSVKSVLEAKNLKGIIDVLANIIKVDEDYEKAIESALGGAIQNIVTESSEDAKTAIEFLKQKKSGRATFLPIDSVKGKELQLKDTIIASDLVKTEDRYKGIIKQLLGKTIVVDTMDEGIKISKIHNHKYRIVTKQGEIFNVGGAITGGAYVKSGNILSRKREIEELKLAIEIENKKKNDLEKIHRKSMEYTEALKLEKQSIETEAENLKKSLSKIKVDLIDKENKLSYEEENYKNLLKEAYQFKGLQELNSKRLWNLQDQSQQLDTEIEILKQSLEYVITDSEKKKELLNEILGKIAKLRERSYEYKAQLKSREILLEQAKSIYNEIKNRHDEQVEEHKQILKSISKSKEELSQLKKNLIDGEKVCIALDESLETIRKEYTEVKEDINSLKEQIKTMEQRKFVMVEERYRIENKVDRIESVISNNSIRLIEEYNLTLDEAQELRDEKANTSKSYVGKIKSAITALGNINLDAIEEYEKISERYLLFLGQKTDLELSLGELEKITSNIEKTMRKEFKKEFVKINELFKETFKELFGGGEGELVLSDEDDILNCEIEIHAQPPGKKLKNISVMSGGERALTAIAILFAILMTRPTPFCFLDEIDAPLDDVNIYRYNKYIQSLAKETQFITITHRRGTMEASDYIYGVTMEDKGVSKIVSLKLEEAENYMEN
ncbi:MAG: chromosome segregation protein SMC [Filifactoraceae bacterium]